MAEPATTDQTPVLDRFEGADVVGASVKIINAGDGLSAALGVEARQIRRGEHGYLLLEWDCTKVEFPPLDKDDLAGDAVRLHTLRAGAAVFVGEDVAGDLIDDIKDKVLRAREADAGIVRWQDGAGLCPYPGCPLDEDHDGDHGYDPASGIPDPAGVHAPDEDTVDTARVRAKLGDLKKDQLRALCVERNLTFGAKATGAQLVAHLIDQPDIEAAVDALTVPDNVHPIGRTAEP